MTKPVNGQPAIDFTATTIQGERFTLSQYKGGRILLSFFRNGACAMCNLRVHELIKNYQLLTSGGIKVVAVFESSVEDMIPYVGRQSAPFVLLSDPLALIYNQYGVESSPEKVNAVIQNHTAAERIKEAAGAGFQLMQQEGSNFFRMPADFLIDENFLIAHSHYSDYVIDHLPLNEVVDFRSWKVTSR